MAESVRLRSRAPVMPEHVAADPVAAEAWQDVVRELEPAGLLSPVDAPVLELLAVAASTARAAATQIRRDGITVKRRGELARHPALTVFNQATGQLLRAAIALGCTPAARLRMPAPRPDLDDGDLD